MTNANTKRTDGTLGQNRGWLKKERQSRRDEVMNRHERVWKHDALHFHKMLRAERAGVETQTALRAGKEEKVTK